MNLDKLTTEMRNPETLQLDQMSVADVLKQMNEEDKKVPLAISEVLGEIEAAVEQIVSSFKAGGRLIYMGAGTSGRLLAFQLTRLLVLRPADERLMSLAD